MDQEFKDFIVKRHEQMDEKTMDCFLDCITNYPEIALTIIKENLERWVITAAVEMDKPVLVCDYDATCQELLNVFTEHFLENKKTH